MACISNEDNKTILVKQNHSVCPVSFRSLYSNMNGHNGLDIPAKRWQPIYAAQSGRVDEVCTEVARGLGVGVRTLAPNGKWYRHRYWHLIAIDVESGDELNTGDLIGYADSTGFSSGDHLHFELKEVDRDGRVLNQGNGYFGAVDPLPFMENKFALEIKGIVSTISLIREKLAILSDLVADWLRNR
jgi:murein DD-endopeptidase MepM/ murein hydrolase activator NlpD